MEKIYPMIQSFINCLSGLHLSAVPATDAGVLEYINKTLHSIVNSVSGNNSFLTLFRAIKPGSVYEIKGYLEIYHLVLRDPEYNQFLILGPCLISPFTRNTLSALDEQFEITREEANAIISLVSELPVISSATLHQLGVLLAYYLLDIPQPVPYQYLEERWDPIDRQHITLVEHYDELIQIRQTEQRYELSAAMTEAVKQGNLSLAYHFMQEMRFESNSITRNPDPLRNSQNMCIIMNTQLRYAMEEIGIHPYQLDRFSHTIALQIEKLRSVREAQQYCLEILQQYCGLAHENTHSHLKPLTRLAITYIKTHLSDTLTVSSTAQALTVNANYLSSQFHQDTGLTFTEFVNKERANQAASLLKHTNLQVQQIASAVGYNNASYFAKQFIKYQGMTPREYRGKI